jgi:hypothetical protein
MLRLQLTAIEPYIVRHQGVTAAATAVTIESAPLRAGELVWVKNFGLANDSGESVAAVLGITDLDGFLQVTPSLTIANGEGYALATDFWIREGMRVSVKVTGTANSAPVRLFGSGLYFAEVDCGRPLETDGSIPR